MLLGIALLISHIFMVMVGIFIGMHLEKRTFLDDGILRGEDAERFEQKMKKNNERID